MNLRDLFYESDLDKASRPLAPAKPAPVPAPVPSFGFGAAAPALASVTSIAVNDEIYQRIKSKTDFDQTPAGQTLAQFIAPLAGIITDEAQRFKAALAQAGTQSGLTGDKILSVLDGLKIALQNEIQEFNDAARSQTEQEVSGGIAEVAQLDAQIAELQQKRQQRQAAVTAAQTKIASGSQQFSLAATRRGQELDQQKQKFQQMLK